MNTHTLQHPPLKALVRDLFIDVDHDGELYLPDVYLAISRRSEVTNSSDMTDSLWDKVFSVSSFISDSNNPGSDFNLVCSAVKFKESFLRDQRLMDSSTAGNIHEFTPRSARPRDTEMFSLQWTNTLTKTEVIFEPFTDVKVGHCVKFHSEMWKPEFNSTEFVRVPKLETPWSCVQYKSDAVKWLDHHSSQDSHLITSVTYCSGYQNSKRQKLIHAKNEKVQPFDTLKSESHTIDMYCAHEKIPWPTQEDLKNIEDMQVHKLHQIQAMWNPEAVKIRYAHLNAIKLRQVVEYSTILHSKLLTM